MKLSGYSMSLFTKFIAGVSFILVIALGISFTVLAYRQEAMIMGQVEREARVLFRQVVITRKWIADHGGVYIEKMPWMKPSPYLNGSEFRDISGKRYLIKTPAMVTKELSQYAGEQGLYWFHITSLKLTNPENAPDEFEKRAIRDFEDKKYAELFAVETIDRSKFLRYIAPLYFEESCLRCHSHQGYLVGDVRGAISITIPVDKTLDEISGNRQFMLISGVLTVLIMIAGLFIMINRLVLSPARRLKKSMHEFSGGNYVSGDLIRSGDEFEDLSRSFAAMARTISGHHTTLNEKVRSATKELAEANERMIETNRLLQEISQRKSDFIAGASHELRTPLTTIKGAMDYISTRMASHLQDDSPRKSMDDLQVFFELIKKNAERMIRMINDMLDIERIETGQSELHFSGTDLAALVDEVITYFQPDSEKRKVVIERVGTEPVLLCADEDRIRQVLINLVSNALKYAPDSSRITVKLEQAGPVVTSSVCDEGPGIPEDEHSRIFEKFYRCGDREGAGLGLAVCRSIVEAHKGRIFASDNHPKGACVTFSLPREQAYCEEP
jgi:signal transduction histidine kinase